MPKKGAYAGINREAPTVAPGERVRIYPNFVQLYGTVARISFWDSGGKTGKHPPMTILTLLCQDPKDGKWNNWQETISFGGLAVWCNEYLKAGLRVLILGHIVRDRYVDKKTRQIRTKTQIKMRQIFLAPMRSKHLKRALLLSEDADAVEAAPTWGRVVDDELDSVGMLSEVPEVENPGP